MGPLLHGEPGATPGVLLPGRDSAAGPEDHLGGSFVCVCVRHTETSDMGPLLLGLTGS